MSAYFFLSKMPQHARIGIIKNASLAFSYTVHFVFIKKKEA